ncbi:MAG TPA: universal stress protein [Pyrinomonadaceae bacterium]|nr:universal stress protein [Pyrinomonadaceae bacterium]
MMRVLVAYDGSAYSDAALKDLRRAGLPEETQALVVSVADALAMPSASVLETVETAMISRRVTAAIAQAQSNALQAFTDAKEYSEKAAASLRSYFPHWEVRSEALAGTPSEELLRKAELWRPDLIVVGSQGRSALGRLLLGSVSKKVATNANSSVRVARRGAVKADDMPPRLIIGVDGSTGAERAVREVGLRAWPEGTKVRIIAVDDGASPIRIGHIPPRTAAMIGGRNEEDAVQARMMVEWAESELSAIGLQVSVEMLKGRPEQILIEESNKWEADCIFAGSSGSVATALVTNAACSVEVVR